MRKLSRADVVAYAARSGLRLTDVEADEFAILSDELLEVLAGFERLPGGQRPRVAATRELVDPAQAPPDPCNAVIRWCRVKGTGSGLLDGKRIGVKDSMSIAGLPLTAGSTHVLEGYVPDDDAVLVERVIEQGGEIVAMLNMDAFAFSGGGETADRGPARNPYDPGRTAAGSSGGSAVALHYDGFDITYGTDQGGSIRLPAAWCGVLGIKPTFGLVPYGGILSLDATIDHAGPLARTAADLALGLQAVAGPEPGAPVPPGLDPSVDYVAAVAEAPADLRGLRVGVLAEGSGAQAQVEPQVQAAVDEATEELRALGAEVREVSIPEHLTTGLGLGFALFLEGLATTLRAHGRAHAALGRYPVGLATALHRGLQASADELPDSVKIGLILGTYVREYYSSTLYGKAQNMRPALRAAYDRALAEVDVLLMPTTPMPPLERRPDQSISECVRRGWSMLGNCTPFNMSGHPSISLPAAEADGLPVGVMLSARMFDDARLLSIASTCEQARGWRPQAAPAGLATSAAGQAA